MIKKIILWLTLSILASTLHAGLIITDTKIIVEDTTVYDFKLSADTIIIRNNAVVYADYPGCQKLFLLESGGKMKKQSGKNGFFTCGAGHFVNNSGPDALEDMTLSLAANNHAVAIKGTYPTTFYGFFSGFGTRDVRLEQNITITGRIFNGYPNSLILNGYTLTLGKDAFFEKLSEGHPVIIGGNGSKVVQELYLGISTIIPLGESANGTSYRTDFGVSINPSTELGTNPKIILQLEASADSANVFMKGSATANYMKRFVRVSYEDVTNPDFNFFYNNVTFTDVVGDPAKMKSAFFNGTSWEYQNNIVNLKPSDPTYVTSLTNVKGSGVLASGLDLGLDVAGCYAPEGFEIINLLSDSLIIGWSAASAIDSLTSVEYRQLGSSTWNVQSALVNKDTVTGLLPDVKYEVRLKTVCKAGFGESVNTPVFTFNSTVKGYNVEKKILNVSEYDTLNSYIKYDSIIINNGGHLIVVQDFYVVRGLRVNAGGILDFGNYSYINATTVNSSLLALAGSTVKYSKKYIAVKDKFESACRNNKYTQFNKNTVIVFTGNDLRIGQTLNTDNLTQLVGAFVVDGGGLVTNTDNLLSDSLIINKGKLAGGIVTLKGSKFVHNEANFEQTIELKLVAKNIPLTGTADLKVKSIEISDSTLFTMNNDVAISGTLKLNKGSIDLKNNTLKTPIFTFSDTASINGEQGGVIEYVVKDYQKLVIPYAAGGEKYTVTFTPKQGTFDATSLVRFTLGGTTPANIGTAPVNYLNRFLKVEPINIAGLVYDLTITYNASDVVGTDANMEGFIYTGEKWNHTYKKVDVANKTITFNQVSTDGIFTAGNYLGYNNAKAIDVKADNVTTDGATINWKFMDAGVTAWTVNFKLTSSSAWSAISSDSLFKRLVGLTAGTSYDVFVSTAQNGSYPSIGNSDTITFITKSGTCNQPINLSVADITNNTANVTWLDGQADYSVKYRRYLDSWANATTVSKTTTSATLTGLAEQTVYILKVESACGAVSDSVMFNTVIPNYDVATGVLYINDKRDIPAGIVYNQVVIDTMGDVALTDDLKVLDSLLINKKAAIDFKTFVVNSFYAKISDSVNVKTGNIDGFSSTLNEGSVKAFVKSFNQSVFYTFNGTAPQKLNVYLPKGKPDSVLKYLIIDNPTSVTWASEDLRISEKLLLKQGKLLFSSVKKQQLIIGGVIENNSSEDALNNGNIFLTLDGGDLGGKVAKIIGSVSKTIVDSISQTRNDNTLISQNIDVRYKFDVSYYYYEGNGFIIDSNITVTLKPTCFIKHDSKNYVRMGKTSKIVMELNSSLLDSTLFFPIGVVGDNNDLTRLTVKINGSSVLGTNPYFSIQTSNTKNASVFSDTNYLKRYVELKGEGISSLSYETTLKFRNGDEYGDKKMFYSNLIGTSSLITQDTIDWKTNTISLKNVSQWGAVTAGKDLKVIGIKSVKGSLQISLSPNPVNDVLKIDGLTGQKNVLVSVIDLLGNTVISQSFKGVNNASIDMSYLIQGVYIVKVDADGELAAARIFKK